MKYHCYAGFTSSKRVSYTTGQEISESEFNSLPKEDRGHFLQDDIPKKLGEWIEDNLKEIDKADE